VKRRVVPFAPALTSDGTDQAWPTAEQLNKLIEQQEAAGWTYSHLDTFSELVQPGCLGALLGHRTQIVNVRLAVFEKAD
jgi:hypothetical protein